MNILYKVLCDGMTLLDQTRPGYYLTEAKLNGEVNNGVFDGQFNFSMYADNPNYDAVRLMTSTIVVLENDREIFRGRPVTIDDSFDAVRKVTCESEMKFLVDVPNVFGKLAEEKRTDVIGNEKTPQTETMVPVPGGAEQTPKPMYTGYRNVDKSQLTRFGENRKWQNRTVYRNSVNDNEKAVTGTRVGPGTDQTMDQGRTRFSLYSLRADDLGVFFDVEYREGTGEEKHYIIPLKTCAYKLFVYDRHGYSNGGLYDRYFRDKNVMISSALYIGNIQMIGQSNQYFNIANFDPEEKITVVGESEQVNIGDLPFCIVYYPDAQHWFFSEPDMYITEPLLHWILHFETVVYAVPEPVSSTMDKIYLKVYKTSDSTVQAVANQIFGEYEDRWARHTLRPGEEVIDISSRSEMTDEDKLYRLNDVVYKFVPTGYNAYADAERRIYRGQIAVDGKASRAYADSCYASLEKWLKETGGYARIRREYPTIGAPYSVIDLMPDSGERRSDFYVRLSDNLTDASRNNDCTGIVSGVFARGVWDEGRSEVTFRSVGTIAAGTAQEMSDPTERYVYTGQGESYLGGKAYTYSNGKWTLLDPVPPSVQVERVASPQRFIDPEKAYGVYSGRDFYFIKGSTYYTNDGILYEDKEAHKVVLSGEFEVDYRLGVLWHKEARATYGSIIFYQEEDLADIAEGSRLQRLAELAKTELQSRLTAFESIEVSAVDPRLISANGGRPELGNYYPVEIPHFGVSTYKRLTRVETDLLDPNASKLTFGGKTPMLSDYVAKKGERND